MGFTTLTFPPKRKIPLSGHDQLSQFYDRSFLIIQNEGLKPTLSVSNFHIANLKRCFQFIGNHQKVVSTPISTENIPYPLNKSIKINSNPLQNTS